MMFGWVSVGGWVGGWEKACLGCISEILRCKTLIFGRDIGVGCVRFQCDGVTLI